MVLFLYYIHFCIRLHLPLITCHFLATVHALREWQSGAKKSFFRMFRFNFKKQELKLHIHIRFFFDATLPFSRAKHCRKAVKTSINIIKFVYATTFSPFPGQLAKSFVFVFVNSCARREFSDEKHFFFLLNCKVTVIVCNLDVSFKKDNIWPSICLKETC